MIVGVGLDMTEIPRIAALVDRWGDRFLNRVFTAGERAHCQGRAREASHLAARFAAKEATLKALSVPQGLSWHEMEVCGGGNRPPSMVLSGRALAAADALGVGRLFLTLTHTDDVAAAVVIAEGALP